MCVHLCIPEFPVPTLILMPLEKLSLGLCLTSLDGKLLESKEREELWEKVERRKEMNGERKTEEDDSSSTQYLLWSHFSRLKTM